MLCERLGLVSYDACAHLHTSYFISTICQITKYQLMPIPHKELPLAMSLPENECYKLLVQVGLAIRAEPGGREFIRSHGRNKPEKREIIL